MKLKLLAVSVAVTLMVVIGACASQPPPPCPIAVGNPLGVPSGGSPLGFSGVQFALPNFWASYKATSGAGACAELAGEEVGFQSYQIPNKPNETTFAVRPFRLSYFKGNPNGYGAFDFADYDPSNDTDENGDPDPAHPVPDPVFRTDAEDPDGARVNSVGKLTAFPTNSLCEATDVSAADQTFQQEQFDLLPNGTASTVDQGGHAVISADAGTVTFPALHIRYEWKDMKFVSTSEVPGSVFTATLNYTEDTCTATYAVTGIWPITLCHTDLDCSPNPLPDAGVDDIGVPGRRFQGSGLNPALQTAEKPFKCNNSDGVHAFTANYGVGGVYDVADWGVCEMTRDVSELTAVE